MVLCVPGGGGEHLLSLTTDAGVSSLSHCRTFVRQTGQNVRQAIFKYDLFFWKFEEKITFPLPGNKNSPSLPLLGLS